MGNPKFEINAQRKDGYNALTLSCKNGWKEGVKLLLGSPKMEFGHSLALCLAAFYGHKEMAISLFPETLKRHRFFYSEGLRKKKSRQIVELLLEAGFDDVNRSDRSGYSPFLSSCGCGHLEIAEILFAHPKVEINRHILAIRVE